MENRRNRIELENQKQKKVVLLICSIIIILWAGISIVVNTRSSNVEEKGNEENINDIPVIDLKDKKAEELTWEEYSALSEDEQAIFPDYFESMDAYKEWYNQMQQEGIVIEDVPTIDLKGKSAEELTWEEYSALSEDEQAIFPDCFESMDAYKEWYKKAEQEGVVEEDVFTLDLKGKEPEELTWEEYSALSGDEQAVFPDYFESYDDFTLWLKNNEPEE